MQPPQPRGLLRIEAALQRRNLRQRRAQRQHVPRIRRAQRHLCQQPFHIENAAELFAQFGAQDGLLQELPHGVETQLDLRAVHRGPQQPLAQQPAAHAGERGIEHRQHRGPLRAANRSRVRREDRLQQFQVAHRDRVQHHAIGAVVIGRAVQVVERGALRVAQIVQDGARRAHRGGVSAEAAAIQRRQLEVLAQRAAGVVVGEDPVLQFRAHEPRSRPLRSRQQRQVRRGQHLARAKLFQRPGHLGRVHIGGAEFAG